MTREEIREKIRSGGHWLGTARGWMQARKHNGSRVRWGSQEILLPHMTVKDVEDLALEVAVTAVMEYRGLKIINE